MSKRRQTDDTTFDRDLQPNSPEEANDKVGPCVHKTTCCNDSANGLITFEDIGWRKWERTMHDLSSNLHSTDWRVLGGFCYNS